MDIDRKYPILYTFRRCPYAMRARLAIKASGVIVELREVKLKNKPEELLNSKSEMNHPKIARIGVQNRK